MRILGVSQLWEKLKQDIWTTFRFERKDRDWRIGEVAQIVLHPRSKKRQVLGLAQIVKKEPRWMDWQFPKSQYQLILLDEIKADGFEDWESMYRWLLSAYGINSRLMFEAMNKLTLQWKERRRDGIE